MIVLPEPRKSTPLTVGETCPGYNSLGWGRVSTCDLPCPTVSEWDTAITSVTSARPGSQLGAQRTPAAERPPSGRGHRASGELASRRRGCLGIEDSRGCRSRSGRDPGEARAAVAAPPAAPGAGHSGRGAGLQAGREPEQLAEAVQTEARRGGGSRGRGRCSREGPQQGWNPAPARHRGARRGHGAGGPRLRAAARPGLGGSVAGRSLGLYLLLLC